MSAGHGRSSPGEPIHTARVWRHAALPLLPMLVLPLQAQAIQRSTAPLSTQERRAVATAAAKTIDSLYVIDSLGSKMRAAIEQALRRGTYDTIVSPSVFAEAVTRQLRGISRDEHVRLIFDPYDPRLRPKDADSLDAAERYDRAVFDITIHNFGVRSAEVLPGGIGYIDLRNFNHPRWASAAFEAAMNFVSASKALIIDLRHNGGGHGDMLTLALSYFFEEPTKTSEMTSREKGEVLQTWTYAQVPGKYYGQARRVFVLVGDSTFSAAEGFASIMKAFKKATIIGSRTRGGAHMGDFYPVGDRFMLFVPTAAAEHDEVEGRGVLADIVVSQADALRRGYLEALIAARQSVKKPYEIAAYDALIAQARDGAVREARVP
jgi:retinol-binding protein 3